MIKLMRLCCSAFLKLQGWKWGGDLPDFERRIIIITDGAGRSDFWKGLAVLGITNYYATILVDDAFINGWRGKFLRLLKCSPYRFSDEGKMKEDMVERLRGVKRHSTIFSLRLANESDEIFRDTFYDVAVELNQPILLVRFLDEKKEIKIDPVLYPVHRSRDLAYLKKVIHGRS